MTTKKNTKKSKEVAKEVKGKGIEALKAGTDKSGEALKKGAEKLKEVAKEVKGKGIETLKAGTDKSGKALKKGAEKLGEFVKVGTDKLGKFTSHATELAKLKIEDHRLNSELNKQFQAVGQKLWRLYRTQKLNDVEASFSKDFKKLAKIEDKLEKNRKLQK